MPVVIVVGGVAVHVDVGSSVDDVVNIIASVVIAAVVIIIAIAVVIITAVSVSYARVVVVVVV